MTTPRDMAAAIEEIRARMEAALCNELASRQHALEHAYADLGELAAELRAIREPRPEPATSPGALSRSLTGMLNGPHSDDATADAGWLAAEAVRYLNYATASHAAGVTSAATAHRLLVGLGSTADRLPQALGQLAGWLQDRHGSGRLAHDDGSPAGPKVDEAATALYSAAWRARYLAEVLAQAQNAIAFVHDTGPGESR